MLHDPPHQTPIYSHRSSGVCCRNYIQTSPLLYRCGYGVLVKDGKLSVNSGCNILVGLQENGTALTVFLFSKYVVVDHGSRPAISPLNYAQGTAKYVRNVLVNL